VGEFPQVKFVKVNTVEAEEIAMTYGVDALPTFQFFKNGQRVGEFKGSEPAAVEAAIKVIPEPFFTACGDFFPSPS